jgi:hypothetical protein
MSSTDERVRQVVEDRDGWPVREGARVYAKPRPTRLAPGFEVSGCGGVVLYAWTSPRYPRGVVELIDPNGGRRTLRAELVRVQRPKVDKRARR